MKVLIDKEVCAGCGLCSDTMPELFVMNGDISSVKMGKVFIDSQSYSMFKSKAKECIENCPVEAIKCEEKGVEVNNKQECERKKEYCDECNELTGWWEDDKTYVGVTKHTCKGKKLDWEKLTKGLIPKECSKCDDMNNCDGDCPQPRQEWQDGLETTFEMVICGGLCFDHKSPCKELSDECIHYRKIKQVVSDILEKKEKEFRKRHIAMSKEICAAIYNSFNKRVALIDTIIGNVHVVLEKYFTYKGIHDIKNK